MADVVGRDIIKYPKTPEGDREFQASLRTEPLYPQNEVMSVPEYNKQETARLKAIADRAEMMNGPVTLSNVGAPAGSVQVGDGTYAYRSPVSAIPVSAPRDNEAAYQDTYAQYKNIVDRMRAPHDFSQGIDLTNQLNSVGPALKDLTLKRMDSGLPINPGVMDTPSRSVARDEVVARSPVAAIDTPGGMESVSGTGAVANPSIDRSPLSVAGLPVFPGANPGGVYRKGVRNEIDRYKNKIMGGL